MSPLDPTRVAGAALKAVQLRPPARLMELLRYVVAGVCLTLASHGLYLFALAAGLAPPVSWTLSFVAGIGLAYVVHQRFVFQAAPVAEHWLSFPLSCVLRLGLGQGMLFVMLRLDMSPGWAGFLTNAALAPVGYVLTRIALKRKAIR